MSDLLERKSVKKVKDFLANFDSSIELIVLEETARTAKDAAQSLNQSVGSIVKSLLFKDSRDNYHLCLVSGDKYASTDKISKIVGLPIKKADAEECKKITGFSIGGVAPIAHDISPKKILIDINLSKYEFVFAAAGHHQAIFKISFTNLCELSKGNVSSITE